MKFSIARNKLLGPLSLVGGVVERRHTLPVLSNLLLVLDEGMLSMTGTDLEVELVGRVLVDSVDAASDAGELTAPARKLIDICRSLPEDSDIEFNAVGGKLEVRSGRSRFTLATLPPTDFPNIEDSIGTHQFRTTPEQLGRLIERTAFSMAQQDVRYYLNGMLWELSESHLRVVATDGHRLAMCTTSLDLEEGTEARVILPRKGVLELARLLRDEQNEVAVVLGANHLRVTTEGFTFTSKLVDGRFPDYEKVLPRAPDKIVQAPRDELRQALSRAAIVSNEKFHGVVLQLAEGSMKILANNPEQEEAEVELSVDYQGGALEIGFNVDYLLDVLSVLSGETVKLSLSDANSRTLLEEAEDGDSLYVIMPMRL